MHNIVVYIHYLQQVIVIIGFMLFLLRNALVTKHYVTKFTADGRSEPVDQSGDEKKRSSSCCSAQDPKRSKFMSSENAAGTATEENDNGSPPKLSIKLTKTSDLPNTSKPWDDADLPVDVLLLTVEDCEFSSCFFYLDEPFKSYCRGIGHVYFGCMGRGDQKKLKIALIKCSKGSAVPGGSLTVVKNAVRILCPKAVFSVGTCIGLNAEKTNLGDVVVSSKLTTSVYRTPVSRDIGNLIRHVADGWKAPLENPDAREVRVLSGDVVSHPEAASFGWQHEQIIQKYPEAIAVETEGEGVFAAAHDDKMEWVLVKGVASYEKCSQSLSSDEWKCFASTTAASVVANILSDPAIFQGWLHYNQDSFSPEQGAIRRNDIASGWSGASGSSKQVHCDQEAYPVKPFDVKTCRSKLAKHYKTRANVPTCVWSSAFPVKLDQIYTRLSWVKKERTPTGSSESKLTHYSDLFKEDANGDVPKRILVQGQTGIGKTMFVKKLAVDWAQLVDEKTGDEQASTLRKYENNEGREDVIEARNKKGIQGDEDMLSEDEDTSSEDDECTSHEKREDTNGNRSDVLRKFELLLVVTLKEISSCQTWKEVINGSRLFPKDKEFSTDDLCSYIHNNEKRVLLVFDGFDEYRIGSEAEAKQFCRRSNSPICEIFHGDYLRGCTVLVTSRSSRAVELQGSADKHAEITGFDEKDQVAFMRKMLESDGQVEDLFVFLRKKNMLDLARVPLLNLFFCLLWRQEKQNLMELTKGKTKLYQAIIRHILLYGHKRHFPDQVSKVNEENYHEILNEIGKVALESLLKGNQVFEYGQVSEKVRGEKSLIVGLLQLSENGASLEPMEKVSFIHKSIQEYLAAWYINNECVSVDNLGRIEEHARTLEDCETLENVFQFICGLSSEGAGKVFKHLSTVRVSDPSLDLSKIVPDEESETCVALYDPTWRQEKFNDLVLNCFREVSTEAKLVKHWFHCSGGIVILYEALGPKLLSKPEVLIQAAHPWAFLFHSLEEKRLYKSMKYLSLYNTPLGINESSEVLKQGDFVTKFWDIQCKKCGFSSVLCCRDGQIQYYITGLWLQCDAHARVFTEAAATTSIQSLSANLCSNQSCLKFLTDLNYTIDPNVELTKHAVAIIRNFKHLKTIGLDGNCDYLCDLLEQVPNPEPYNFEIGRYDFYTLTSTVADRFAALLPRFPNIAVLRVDLRDCCAESVTKLFTSLPHETLTTLQVKKISFSPEAAEALGRALPEMTSLSILSIHGKNESILRAKEMEALFAGFNKPMYYLVSLCFTHFRVRGNLGPLMKSLRFFPNLEILGLNELDMDSDGLCLLLDSFRFIRNVYNLELNCNPLGQAVRYIVPHLTNLPKLKYLSINNTGCSEEDLTYVRKTAAIELLPGFCE